MRDTICLTTVMSRVRIQVNVVWPTLEGTQTQHTKNGQLSVIIIIIIVNFDWIIFAYWIGMRVLMPAMLFVWSKDISKRQKGAMWRLRKIKLTLRPSKTIITEQQRKQYSCMLLRNSMHTPIISHMAGREWVASGANLRRCAMITTITSTKPN